MATSGTADLPAGVVVADGRTPPWRPGTFDRVLVDAPCTGLGALRRRPEARWRRQPGDLAQLGPLQRDLLRSALDARFVMYHHVIRRRVHVELEAAFDDPLAEHICARSREAVMAEIGKLPRGTWHNTMTVDGYDSAVTLAAALTVSDSGIHVDFSGTSPQST